MICRRATTVLHVLSWHQDHRKKNGRNSDFSIPNPMTKKNLVLYTPGKWILRNVFQINWVGSMHIHYKPITMNYTMSKIVGFLLAKEECCLIFSYLFSLLQSMCMGQLVSVLLGFSRKTLALSYEKCRWNFQPWDGKMTLTKGSSKYTPSFKLQPHSF